MKRISLYWIFFGFSIALASRPAFSTVGGNQEIEIWGHDVSNQQIILALRHFDESDIDFDLLAYQIPTRQLITVQGFPHWYEGDKPDLKNALADFKKSLVPLSEWAQSGLSLHVKVKKQGVESPVPGDEIKYADQIVEILSDGKRIAETEVRSYRKFEVELVKKAILRTPDVKLLVIRHWGDWMEMGYTIDRPLFIPAVSQKSQQKAALYALQILSLNNEAGILAEKKKLEAKGLKPFVEKANKDGQDVYRLKVGYFLLKSQAEQEKAKLKSLFGHNAIVITMAPPQ